MKYTYIDYYNRLGNFYILVKSRNIEDNAEKTYKLHQSANLKLVSPYLIKTLYFPASIDNLTNK